MPGDDETASHAVLAKLGITKTPQEVYRAGEGDVEILFDRRTVHVNTMTGHVVDEGQKPRFLLRIANWLHLNRGKKQWTYFADGYAAGLLFLALSGIFMLPGRKGLFGRALSWCSWESESPRSTSACPAGREGMVAQGPLTWPGAMSPRPEIFDKTAIVVAIPPATTRTTPVQSHQAFASGLFSCNVTSSWRCSSWPTSAVTLRSMKPAWLTRTSCGPVVTLPTAGA